VREISDALPGSDLIREGLRDLAAGVESVADAFNHNDFVEHRLYDLLAVDDPDGAHSRYNSLIRRLVSFERAAECVSD
jgi:hypothetical protein